MDEWINKRKTILAAFQNSSEMESILNPLQSEGYRILKADSFLRFFTALERYEIDLIIAEVELPGISIAALLPFLNQKYPLLKTIVVMKHYSSQLELDLRSHNVLYVMSWPVNGDLLISIVAKGLEHRVKSLIYV